MSWEKSWLITLSDEVTNFIQKDFALGSNSTYIVIGIDGSSGYCQIGLPSMGGCSEEVKDHLHELETEFISQPPRAAVRISTCSAPNQNCYCLILEDGREILLPQTCS